MRGKPNPDQSVLKTAERVDRFVIAAETLQLGQTWAVRLEETHLTESQSFSVLCVMDGDTMVTMAGGITSE